MKITIKEVTISYFKGIRSLHLSMNEDITSIYGDNGTGKSTICDAIQWVLFGRNSDGSAQFSIKTLDAKGNVIPNVKHSVKLSLDIDGTIRDLEKVYVEEKVTRRGKITDEIKHTTEYYIDGESFTKKDYEAFIANIINESTFKAVTDPRYFHSLHWKEQRTFLERLAGDIDYSSIDNDSRFDDITHNSQFKTIEEYLTHKSYNLRQTKEKIDAIPIRIEEVRMSRPETMNWEDAQEEIVAINKKIDEYNKTLYALENNTKDSINQHIRQQIEFERRRLDNIRTSCHNMAEYAFADFTKKHSQLLAELNEKKVQAQMIDKKRASLLELTERALETLNELRADKENLKKEFEEVKAEKLILSPDDFVCPTCGQPFDEDKKAEMIAKIKQNWLVQHESKKTAIKEKNGKLNERIADAEALVKSYQAESDSIDINKLNEDIFALKEKVESLTAPLSAEQRIAEHPDYANIQAKIKELEAQLEGTITTDNSATIENIKSEITKLTEDLNLNNRIVSQKEYYDKCTERMFALESEMLTLQNQYDKLLEEKELAIEYQSLRDNLLEESVNNKFSVVQFRLFETLNDGTRKPNCVCWISTSHGLVPYEDANSCAKINAGRDIINTISVFYDIYAPCITDNAESSNVLRPLKSQDIRLYVSHDKELTIR